MLLVEMRCQMCGDRFEATVLDREISNESHERGEPVRCPRCSSMQIDRLRIKQVITREAYNGLRRRAR